MIKIKVCGLTRPQDAELAVACGADAVGLIFAPSPRRVSAARAKAILRRVPPTVLAFGVFVDQDPQWIKGLIQNLGLDRIQFHGQEPDRVLRLFSSHCVVRALKPKAHDPVPGRDPARAAGAFLVDAYVRGQAGGTGKLSNWAFARGLKKFNKPLILSGGLNTGNVLQAIRQVKPDMVDVSSGVESSPGIKHPARLRAFIKKVRQNA